MSKLVSVFTEHTAYFGSVIHKLCFLTTFIGGGGGGGSADGVMLGNFACFCLELTIIKDFK